MSRRPSPALCISLLSLFVALGGTTWAAVSLPAGSVGTAQLKDGAVIGQKVKNFTLTGADIKSSTLGIVPSARRALNADNATHAVSADTAGAAYTTHFETAIHLTSVAVTVASLTLPAGNYVLGAKAQIDTSLTSDIVECDVVAGSDVDKSFVQGSASHASQILTNSLVHGFAAAGTADLVCSAPLGTTSGVSQVRLNAVSVGTITAQ